MTRITGGAIAEPPENTAPTLADLGISKKVSSAAQRATVGLNKGAQGNPGGRGANVRDEVRPTLSEAGIEDMEDTLV